MIGNNKAVLHIKAALIFAALNASKVKYNPKNCLK